MAPIATAFRRTLLLVVLAAGVGVALSWRRGHATTPTPGEPPQWPALPERPDPPPSTAPLARPEQPERTDRTDDEQTWVQSNDDGSTPDSHPVKAKESSGIFHVPGGRFYDRTKPDRCYATTDDAEADGYRQSKS